MGNRLSFGLGGTPIETLKSWTPKLRDIVSRLIFLEQFKTNTVSEKDASAGVTVDSVLLKDGGVLLENDSALQGKSSSGTATDIVKINTSDQIEFGTTDVKPETWTPTVAGSGSMAVTGTTINYSKAFRIGNIVFYEISITTTTTGTASNYLTFTLPANAAIGANTYCVGSGGVYDAAWVGALVLGDAAGTFRVYKADTSNYGIGSNRQFRIHGWYEAA